MAIKMNGLNSKLSNLNKNTDAKNMLHSSTIKKMTLLNKLCLSVDQPSRLS